MHFGQWYMPIVLSISTFIGNFVNITAVIQKRILFNMNCNSMVYYLMVLFLSGSVYGMSAEDHTIRVSDLGIIPNTKENIIPLLDKILKKNKDKNGLRLVFENGRYDFYAEGIENGIEKTTIAFDLEQMENVTIEGNGADFIFHGRVMPFRIQRSKNIYLRNFNIDWDRPYNSQAKIIKASDHYVDMEIDPKEYPYEIVNDTIWFLGEGWRRKIVPQYTNLYDEKTKDIIFQTRDRPLGDSLYNAKVTLLGEGRVRFHFKPLIKPKPGTIIVFFHATYLTNGIDIKESANTRLENINIYHTLSCGVHGYKSENISLNNVHIISNDKKDRAFSTIADATHFNGCKGHILFEGCSVSGAGDDFMNIHGMYAKILNIINNHCVLVAPNPRYIGFDPGANAWALDSATMQRIYELKVLKQQPEYDTQDKLIGYIITFDKSILGKLQKGDLLENKDRVPTLTVRNCKMLKKNRARSILVTTPSEVLIENNYFNSAGAAILIEGDADTWFESGAVKNVIIRNNVFEDCYTSGNNIIDNPWGWGEAVISITPSVRPSGIDTSAYHRNIKIEKNVFRHYDYALLFARSVDGLSFTYNKLIKTDSYPQFYRETNLYLDGCRNVKVGKNNFSDDFPGKNITIKNMRFSDVYQYGDKLLITEDKE